MPAGVPSYKARYNQIDEKKKKKKLASTLVFEKKSWLRKTNTSVSMMPKSGFFHAWLSFTTFLVYLLVDCTSIITCCHLNYQITAAQKR